MTDPPRCPRCESARVRLVGVSAASGPNGNSSAVHYACRKCGHEWSVKTTWREGTR